MVGKITLQVWGVHTYKNKLGFKPQIFKDDPLLTKKNRRSIRLFHPSNMDGYKIHGGELWLVELIRIDIQQEKMSADKRTIINIHGRLLATHTEIKKIFSESENDEFDDSVERLTEYLELSFSSKG
jgi:hypothetical protein